MAIDDLTACLALAEAVHAPLCSEPRIVVGRDGGPLRRLEAYAADESRDMLGMAHGRGDDVPTALRALRIALAEELRDRVERDRADVESRRVVLEAMGTLVEEPRT